MSEINKVGMYSTDEILEFMTEGEGSSFLGRSMFDAMYFEIERLHSIIKEVREYIITHKLYNFKYDNEELFEIISDKKAKDYILEILDKVEE